ncbi:MAG: hypothetical protein WAM74_01325 [Xanthobacteraceae bacterium]
MFPNLRLMVVAVLASILGISCALGLFAEFRVSHDSFLRESNAGTPLQLGSSDAAPGRVVNTAAPFEFRFQAPPPPAVVEALGSPETPDRAAVVQTTNAPTLESEPAANPAVAADAPATASDVAAEPAPAPASSDHATETSSPAATGSIAAQNGQSEAPQDGRQNAKPSAEGDLAVRTPATPSAEESAPKSEIAPASPSAAAPEKRRPVALRHRPIIVRRIQRTRSAAPVQGFTTLQPAFQWTLPSGTQSPQPVRRRVIIRRIRPVQKPVVQTTAPQTTVSTTSPE